MTLEQEQSLLIQAQAGNQEALGQLWDELSPKLFGYLVNMLRDVPLAEDVFQSAWLRVVEGLPRFESRGVRVSAWIFAIARNECRQVWRKTNRVAAQEEGEPMSDERQSLHTKLFIEKILEELSPDDQELLRLRYIADLTINDIARVLKINLIAVRVRMSRAVSRARIIATKNL